MDASARAQHPTNTASLLVSPVPGHHNGAFAGLQPGPPGRAEVEGHDAVDHPQEMTVTGESTGSTGTGNENGEPASEIEVPLTGEDTCPKGDTH